MLGGVPEGKGLVALFTPLCPRWSLFARRFRAQRTAEYAGWQVGHSCAFELSGGPACPFFSSISAIAKQSCDRFSASKEMDLKSMRLLLGSRLRVDAADILLRVGISSSFHGLCA